MIFLNKGIAISNRMGYTGTVGTVPATNKEN